jgi:predicted transcriptional regulator
MLETITLSETLQQSLKKIADTQGKSINQVLEEALNLYVASQTTTKPIAKSIGMGSSEITDLSERVDELLWQD